MSTFKRLEVKHQMNLFSWLWRNYVSFATALLIAILGFKGTAWFNIHQVRGADAQPFYLERASYERDQRDVLTMYSHTWFARSTDGRTAFIEDAGLTTHLPGKFPPTRKVTMPDTTSVWLLDNLGLKTSWPANTSREAETEVSVMRNHKPDCGIEQSVITARDQVAGQMTIRTVRDIDTVREVTEWYAPELGCQLLQSVTILKADGKVLLEGRLMKVEVGEPDGRLFDLGSAYSEVTATEFIASRLKTVGLEMDDETRRRAARLDRERSMPRRVTVPKER